MNDNVIDLFRSTPPAVQVGQDADAVFYPGIQEPVLVLLPDDDDIMHLESLANDLSFAESDEEKAAVLKNIAHWLTLWKF